MRYYFADSPDCIWCRSSGIVAELSDLQVQHSIVHGTEDVPILISTVIMAGAEQAKFAILLKDSYLFRDLLAKIAVS
ncbi:MAG: hypothetical protein ABIH23_21410 [bacterium]